MEGGREQNYYPGFVDALSNVVLTLVFVLVIFVFALLMSSNKVAKKMTEALQVEKEQAQNRSDLNEALKDLERARETGGPGCSTQQRSRPNFAKSDFRQKAEINMTTSTMLVLFNINAISVTEQTAKIIANFVASSQAKANGKNVKFVIEAPENPSAATPVIGRETQLGRMLNIRNFLLDAKVLPRNISIREVSPTQENGGYEWVKIYAKE
ncbi:MAG: hypothetical protein PHW76_04965 [Alphaproteobacteria bacterium]|nr:hypothetical protein [Alphaproteobacteria bacterium]